MSLTMDPKLNRPTLLYVYLEFNFNYQFNAELQIPIFYRFQRTSNLMRFSFSLNISQSRD